LRLTVRVRTRIRIYIKKNLRTARTRAREDETSYPQNFHSAPSSGHANAHSADELAQSPLLLPPCPNTVKADQQRDVRIALQRLPPRQRQEVLNQLQHHYAQARYQALTGWQAPAAGGPLSKQLSPMQRMQDWEARMMISRELGHEREQATAVYLGRQDKPSSRIFLFCRLGNLKQHRNINLVCLRRDQT
jgi:DNA-directed RNA polymerase specialized sigma24 family protein